MNFMFTVLINKKNIFVGINKNMKKILVLLIYISLVANIVLANGYGNQAHNGTGAYGYGPHYAQAHTMTRGPAYMNVGVNVAPSVIGGGYGYQQTAPAPDCCSISSYFPCMSKSGSTPGWISPEANCMQYPTHNACSSCAPQQSACGCH